MKPGMSLLSYFLLTLNSKILLTQYPQWSFVLVFVPTTTLASLFASRMRLRRSWREISHSTPCCFLPATLSPTRSPSRRPCPFSYDAIGCFPIRHMYYHRRLEGHIGCPVAGTGRCPILCQGEALIPSDIRG